MVPLWKETWQFRRLRVPPLLDFGHPVSPCGPEKRQLKGTPKLLANAQPASSKSLGNMLPRNDAEGVPFMIQNRSRKFPKKHGKDLKCRMPLISSTRRRRRSHLSIQKVTSFAYQGSMNINVSCILSSSLCQQEMYVSDCSVPCHLCDLQICSA